MVERLVVTTVTPKEVIHSYLLEFPDAVDTASARCARSSLQVSRKSSVDELQWLIFDVLHLLSLLTLTGAKSHNILDCGNEIAAILEAYLLSTSPRYPVSGDEEEMERLQLLDFDWIDAVRLTFLVSTFFDCSHLRRQLAEVLPERLRPEECYPGVDYTDISSLVPSVLAFGQQQHFVVEPARTALEANTRKSWLEQALSARSEDETVLFAQNATRLFVSKCISDLKRRNGRVAPSDAIPAEEIFIYYTVGGRPSSFFPPLSLLVPNWI